MEGISVKEWLYRALRTFFQAAAGYLAANLLPVFTETNASETSVTAQVLTGLFAAAVAAGIAAVMNRTGKQEEEE